MTRTILQGREDSQTRRCVTPQPEEENSFSMIEPESKGIYVIELYSPQGLRHAASTANHPP